MERMEVPKLKKHPCPDCVDCLWCADTRCQLCLKTSCQKKLSFQEQIELYESINKKTIKR
jgi:hypothetical protein